jgi:hypothetical protein
MKTFKMLQAFLLALVLFCPDILAQIRYTPRTPCPVQGYDANAVFDWTQNYYPFYLNGPGWGADGFKSMPSPWTDYANNFNLGDFQYTGRANYAPEYGWVLVKKDFGDLGRRITHPYIILYNKFRGTMRIFVAITEQQGSAAQKAVFKVWFPNDGNNKTPYKSAIFEFNRGANYFNALDKFDNQIPFMKTGNSYSFSLPYWVYTDIATAYDPCTCNYNAKFSFDVELINTTSLQFTANGNIVQQIDGSGGTPGGRQNLLQIGAGAVSAGTSYHGIATNGLSTIASIFSTTIKAPFLKNWIPGLAGAGAVIDFLSGAFGETTPPQPMAFKMDLQATGSLVTNLPHKEQNTDVPGTEHIGRPLIPVAYDNVMGVYNLLETPILQYGSFSSPPPNYAYRTLETKIDQPIKYILNPNAEINLDKFEIYGAIELELRNYVNIVNASANIYKIKTLQNGNQIWRSTTYPLKSLPNVVTKLEGIFDGTPVNSFLRVTLKHKRSIVVKDVPTEEMEEIHIGRFLLQSNMITSFGAPYDPNVFNPPNEIELQAMQDVVEIGNYSPGTPGFINIPAGETRTFYATTKITCANIIVIGGGTLRLLVGTVKEGTINEPNIDYIFFNPASLPTGIVAELGVPDIIKGLLLPTNDSRKETPITTFCNNSVYINRAKNFEANKDEDLSTSVVASSIPKSDNLTIYPNPTATDATFSYAIAKAGATKITVTNMLGIVVSELVHVENHEIGSFEVNLNTQNLPSGIYLCVLQTVEGVQTQKLVVNK